MTNSETESLDFSLADIESATSVIYKYLSATPQISWPLLNKRCGCEVWVKHENHLPTGAFKVRGGVWYTENLIKNNENIRGVIAATRGNHGQSVAFAARKHKLQATVVVPHGNSREKNRAMQGFGAELIEHGQDFNEALVYAQKLAEEREHHLFPSFNPLLVQGVSTYSVELLKTVPDLHTVYVSIGLGSGICGMIAARNALNLKTEVVGVVSENAPAYALSFKDRQLRETSSADTLADGVAVRIPNKQALECILKGVSRVLTLNEQEILDAIGYYFTDTHNLAEGAGSCPLAALLKEKDRMQGKKVGLILSGGNIDWDLYCRANDYNSTKAKG